MTGWLRRLFRRTEEEWSGADLEYAESLHDIAMDMHAEHDAQVEYESVASEFGLDPVDHLSIIEEVITLRRSIIERLDHARARWDRLVEPGRLALLRP